LLRHAWAPHSAARVSNSSTPRNPPPVMATIAVLGETRCISGIVSNPSWIGRSISRMTTANVCSLKQAIASRPLMAHITENPLCVRTSLRQGLSKSSSSTNKRRIIAQTDIPTSTLWQFAYESGLSKQKAFDSHHIGVGTARPYPLRDEPHESSRTGFIASTCSGMPIGYFALSSAENPMMNFCRVCNKSWSWGAVGLIAAWFSNGRVVQTISHGSEQRGA
jgi:hypothetical protein